MNKKIILTAISAALIAALSPTVIAADDGPFKSEIKGRQALMQTYKFNLGILAGMAKGKREYNAEMAARSAKNLNLAAMMDQSDMWPKGSDLTNKDLKVKTTAKIEAWTTFPKVSEAHKSFMAATAKLADAAGNGQDALKAAVGGVGKGCKGCHDDFRQKKK